MLRFALPLCILMTPAAAQTFDDIAQVEVLSGWTTSQGTRMAGLRIKLAPGWKTYWRAPGDAGIPPHVNFSGSENVAATALMWPVPEVFDQAGMRSIGYETEVVVPVEVTPTTGSGAMTLTGTLDIGVCEEICIPVQLPFAALLPPDGGRNPSIVAAMIDRPLTAAEAGVTEANCAVTPDDSGLTVTASLTMPRAGRTEEVVIEAGDPQVWVSEPDVARRGDQLVATVDMVHVDGTAFALDRSAVRITVLGSDHAVDVRGCSAG